MLSHLEIDPGLSLDITQHDEFGEAWDFNKRHMREKAKLMLKEQQPELLVGSPMCTAFSTWQRINRQRDLWRYKRELHKARRHLEFVYELYRMQLESGRLFLHEHPEHASSWTELCIQRMLKCDGVQSIGMDQCQVGQVDGHGNPVKKPTRWMSNSPAILNELDKNVPEARWTLLCHRRSACLVQWTNRKGCCHLPLRDVCGNLSRAEEPP